MGRVPTFFIVLLLASWQHCYSSLLLTEFLWWPCRSSSDGVLTRKVLATPPFSIGSLLKQLGLDLSQPIYNDHRGLVKTLWQSKKPHCSEHTSVSVWASGSGPCPRDKMQPVWLVWLYKNIKTQDHINAYCVLIHIDYGVHSSLEMRHKQPQKPQISDNRSLSQNWN